MRTTARVPYVAFPGRGLAGLRASDSRWAEHLLHEAGAPRWNKAVAATFRRWSGHVARYPTTPRTRTVSAAVSRMDAWWQWTLKAVHVSHNDIGRQRLGVGHRARQTPMGREVSGSFFEAGYELPWQQVGQDRQQWKDKIRVGFRSPHDTHAAGCAGAAEGKVHVT